MSEQVQHRYCLGCRAILNMPPQAEDRWGILQPPPPGFRTEAVECERCGVLDVFLVAEPAGAGAAGEADE